MFRCTRGLRFQSRVSFGCLAALVLGTAVASAEELGEPIRIEVDTSEVTREIAHVQMWIPARPSPTTLVFPVWIPGHPMPENLILKFLKGVDKVDKLLICKYKDDMKISVNGNEIPLTPFPNDIIRNTLTALVCSLKDVERVDNFDIEVEVK